MPEISRFYGIIIAMFAKDHLPPHFHARYAEFRAQIEIDTGEVLEGELPSRALRLIKEWCEIHEEELKYNWIESQQDNPIINKIDPLE